MRTAINKVFKAYYAWRMQRMDYFMQYPEQVQRKVLDQLLNKASKTQWGRRHAYTDIRTPERFAQRVPINDYERLQPWIARMMEGEKDVLWHGRVRWFSKSSGTTGAKSKYIPVSNENLRKCHIRGGWDSMTLFHHQRPDARIFEAKTLLMAGSLSPHTSYPRTQVGDVSAIIVNQLPWVVRPFFAPDFETALHPNFEEKIERTAQILSREPEIVAVGGVPTWLIVLFRRILEITGKSNMLEVWPKFQAYMHGGVNFTPYQQQFHDFLPSEEVSYQEAYNASEGYFAVQNNFKVKDMLLLLDNGIYYEFIPMEEWGKDFPKAIPIWEVETDKHYAIVISTNAGLWRYTPGDTVMFTSTSPYKIKITGRTKQFINAFGEEVMVENTDRAIAMTCATFGVKMRDYTAAPIFMAQGKGGHQWLVEFEQTPPNLLAFAQMLDENLQALNSDYEA
ncbi:MAG: GH3 auxin-responsive promoter family protein, partial [Bacteroidota bacterium]